MILNIESQPSMNTQNKTTRVHFSYESPEVNYVKLILQIGYFHSDFVISLNYLFAPKFKLVADYLVLEDRLPTSPKETWHSDEELSLVNHSNYIEINDLFDFYADFNAETVTEMAFSLGQIMVNCWNALLAENYPNHQAKALCGMNTQTQKVFVTIDQGQNHAVNARPSNWANRQETLWVRPNATIIDNENSAVFVSFNEFQMVNKGMHITHFDYMHALLKQAYVHPDFLRVLGEFYWPELFKRDGLIFLGSAVKSFDEVYYQRLVKEGEVERVQFWMNLILIENAFPVTSPPCDALDVDVEIDIAKSIAVCWNAKLKQDWPNENAKARMMYDEEDGETYLVIDDYLFKNP